MTALFVSILNMSITASIVALLMLLIRAVFRHRLPPSYCYLLEGVVFFRLIVPFSFPAEVSLFGLLGKKTPAVAHGTYVVTMDYLEASQGYQQVKSSDNVRFLEILAAVWIFIAVLMLLYGAVTYITSVLRMRTAFAVKCDDVLQNAMQCAGLHRKIAVCRSNVFDTPVVMGIFHPRIILPGFMDTNDQKTMLHIITHELVHIRRHDHITKVIFTLALMLHWFNPIVWLMYFLFAVDIETSCDEKVLSLLGENEKSGYASSLIALCSAQRRFSGSAVLSFAESNIKNRVEGALEYHRLSTVKTILLSLLVLIAGLVTSTNPVVIADGYTPAGHSVSRQAKSNFEEFVPQLTNVLSQNDPQKLMALAGKSDPYYAAIYPKSSETPLTVSEYKLYPQSEDLCYCYLRMTDDCEYTAVFTVRGGRVYLTTLTPCDTFEAVMSIDNSSEQVRFIKNLHRFGITTGFTEPQKLPRPAVAALCIDEEYRDRVKSGEISADTKYLPPAWIAKAANDYFGLSDFSYTFDGELYDSTQEKYIYSPDRGAKIDAEIIAQRQEGEFTLVTAQLYRDPLHLMVDKTITYRLKKK